MVCQIVAGDISGVEGSNKNKTQIILFLNSSDWLIGSIVGWLVNLWMPMNGHRKHTYSTSSSELKKPHVQFILICERPMFTCSVKMQ